MLATNAEFTAKIYASFSLRRALANLSDLFISELGFPMRRPARATVWVKPGSVPVAACAASLGDHIRRVVSGCSDEEVCGIGTSHVVAPMADALAFGDRPVEVGPDEAMDEPVLPVQLNLSVPSTPKGAEPWPAFIRSTLVNLGCDVVGEANTVNVSKD